MGSLYIKEGIYLVIEDFYSFNEKKYIEHDDCILNTRSKRKSNLYGGRVNLEWFNIHYENSLLKIDGINISNFPLDYRNINDDLIPLSTIAQHLNAIETYGVDAFMLNYKESIETYYKELKEIRQILEVELSNEQDKSKIDNLLKDMKNLREMLLYVLAISFSLDKYMNTGLENEKIMCVYQSIVDTLS